MYLFLDDPIFPGEPDESWQEHRAKAAHLLDVLREVDVTITITSVGEVFPHRAEVRTIGPLPDGGSELSLTLADSEAIIQKWQEWVSGANEREA